MKRLTNKLVAGILAVFLAAVSGPALAQDSSKPIRIPTHNWSSQVVMAYVIGGIFESMGNTVEYVPADSQTVYEAVRNGDITISHEVWQSSFGKSFYNAMAKGGLIDALHFQAWFSRTRRYPSRAKTPCPACIVSGVHRKPLPAREK